MKLSAYRTVLLILSFYLVYWTLNSRNQSSHSSRSGTIQKRQEHMFNERNVQNKEPIKPVYTYSSGESILNVSKAVLKDSGHGFQDTGLDEELMVLTVYILDEQGNIPKDGRVASQLCQFNVPVDEEGSAVIETRQSCDVFASRADGLFRSFSEEVWVEHQPQSEYELEIVLPVERIGGLGVQISKISEGFIIERVYTNTPAEQQGVERGAVIVEVNGVETYDLSTYDFLQLTTGAVGSEVMVRFLDDLPEDPPHRFVRAILE